MHNTEVVSDKHLMALLEAIIPVLEDLRDISGNWNGDEAGHEEEQAHIADEAFRYLTKAMDSIKELNEGA